MNVRNSFSIVAVIGVVSVAALSLDVAQARDSDAGASGWTVPRTADDQPDLQGNWTNGTMTPIQRPEGQAAVLTAEQVAAIEGGLQQFIDSSAARSDPDREAPPEGGVFTGNASFDAASGGTGGYNYFWIDPGEKVAVYDGEPRSSLITRPADGRIPGFTPAGEKRRAALFAASQRFGEYDNPENRPLAERCILSFGSNAGPPMLPNYFYNNNYTIVQTPDHIMIMTEMVHDVRIIPLGEPNPRPENVRLWMGDSRGWWEGDALVIETTNLNPEQLNGYRQFYGASENVKMTERITRSGENTLNYEFTVEDPDTYTSAWGGEVPFNKMADDQLLYEYACHEGNYALSNVLSGARAQEREAANKP